jgi:uncharacterized protein (TIGR00266 family)
MRAEIRNRPDYASLHLVLDRGEKVVTEAGAMMGMGTALELETSMRGGLLGAASRLVGGESIFLNTYTAREDGQRLDVAPAAPGDIVQVELAGLAVMVQSGSFLCATPGVTVDSKWAGFQSFFAGEGPVMLRCAGVGTLWMSSYGAIELIDAQDGFVVDTSHIVAFDESLSYEVTKVGSIKSLLLSSEGLVCRFHGRGRLWIQSRSAPTLAAFLHPFRRFKREDSG